MTYEIVDRHFEGTLTAFNLKPNFAYQLKLSGIPGTAANERIGLAGRWWQEEWNGTAWINGHNLNNKGERIFPNPNDHCLFRQAGYTDPPVPPVCYTNLPDIWCLIISSPMSPGMGTITCG